jgi:hypothetical protein
MYNTVYTLSKFSLRVSPALPSEEILSNRDVLKRDLKGIWMLMDTHHVCLGTTPQVDIL